MNTQQSTIDNQQSTISNQQSQVFNPMARGFESKDVEYQQAEAERAKEVRPPLSAADREVQARRRTIELALASVKGDLASARSPAHREMLEQAIAELEERLAR